MVGMVGMVRMVLFKHHVSGHPLHHLLDGLCHRTICWGRGGRGGRDLDIPADLGRSIRRQPSTNVNLSKPISMALIFKSRRDVCGFHLLRRMWGQMGRRAGDI